MKQEAINKLKEKFLWLYCDIRCSGGYYGLLYGSLAEIEKYCDLQKVDYPDVLDVSEKNHKMYLSYRLVGYNSEQMTHITNIVGKWESKCWFYCPSCGIGNTLRNRINHDYYCEECYNELKGD